MALLWLMKKQVDEYSLRPAEYLLKFSEFGEILNESCWFCQGLVC